MGSRQSISWAEKQKVCCMCKSPTPATGGNNKWSFEEPHGWMCGSCSYCYFYFKTGNLWRGLKKGGRQPGKPAGKPSYVIEAEQGIIT